MLPSGASEASDGEALAIVRAIEDAIEEEDAEAVERLRLEQEAVQKEAEEAAMGHRGDHQADPSLTRHATVLLTESDSVVYGRIGTSRSRSSSLFWSHESM